MIIDHRYEVLEKLGSSLWSNVYKVKDKRTNKLFSLKLFQYISSEELYKELSAEDMHHITRIEHPNLAHIVDFGHVGDHIYSISEYYDGSPLKNFVFKKIQIEILYDIIMQIVYALEALHNQNIYHKDLKPENVLYKIEGNRIEIKVIDYGFSKVESVSEQQTVTGSLPYIAPELFQRKNASVYSDYYSLGVLLYKLTSGSYPFSFEQINSFVTGNQSYFIPKFPSELNSDIPQVLEKFILKLLEKNPSARFQTAAEIINYINRIQNKIYPFSLEWSLVNRIKSNKYIARNSYSHQLLDYVDGIEKGNGKIVSLLGGEGLGKDSILSLYKYHLLNGRYFLFDYNCSKLEHEPFFALIKEFLQSLSKDDLAKSGDLSNISKKFNLYLFKSVKEAKKVKQSAEELKEDFLSVKELLLNLTDVKPIIFIIRNAQFIHKHTIEFLNFISSFVVNHKMLIVLSFDFYKKICNIDHTILIQVPTLTYEETHDYVNSMFNNELEKPIQEFVWKHSAGNPYLIREILLHLIQKKGIVKNLEMYVSNEIDSINLPVKLISYVSSRISHVKYKHMKFLQLLSVVETPLVKELMVYILQIGERELFDFLNDVTYNEVICKNQKYYHFIYAESKNLLRKSLSDEEIISTSNSVISFYKNLRVRDVEICKGVILNAKLAGDLSTQRDFNLRAYDLFNDLYEQESAYKAILEVMQINFEIIEKDKKSNISDDFLKLQEKIELIGNKYITPEFLDCIANLNDSFEKYYLLGTIAYVNEDLSASNKMFNKALQLTKIESNQVLVWFYFVQICTQTKNHKRMKKYLDLLANSTLPIHLNIYYTDRLSLYYFTKNEVLYSIKITEDFLSTLPPVQDSSVLIKLASMQNNLGVFYSQQKMIDDASEHFNVALSIWERLNVKRYLSLIYNNIADLYLKQGKTLISISFSERAYNLANELVIKSNIALALLNLGEAYIKLGDFQKAENYLLESEKLVRESKSDKYKSGIIINLALAKSKINSFGYYNEFINKVEPALMEGSIKEITPLVKTYFYYLYELGQQKKVKTLLHKNTHINYHDIHEDEFYYNTLSLNAILSNNYRSALEHLKQAEKYAGEVKNHYAMVIFYLSEIECFIGLEEFSKATPIITVALEIADRYQYKYWIIKIKYFKAIIDLADVQVSARKVLRDLKEIFLETEKKSYYILKIKIHLLIIQVLMFLKADKDAKLWYTQYRQLLDSVSQGIGEEERKSFYQRNYYYVENIKDVSLNCVQTKMSNIRNYWDEMQFSLIQTQNVDRIKFFISKCLDEIIAPDRYQIMLYSENSNSYNDFLSDIGSDEYILSAEVFVYIEKAFHTDRIEVFNYNNVHNMVIPLQIKYHKIGFIILSDCNELEFTKYEISIMETLKLQMTNLMVRIQDYTEITNKIAMMNKLMTITHSMLKVIDLKTLENEIISACIDFTNSSRGFLIKKDDKGNYSYQVALDSQKKPLSNISGISKTVLSEVQNSKTAVSTTNAQEDNLYKNSISIQDYMLNSIFCSPIVINDKIYGLVYLDNFLDNSVNMNLNPEVIKLLFAQICIVLKNALQYEAIMQKSYELQSLDNLKDEFMGIVSHELNTPLTSLQGYISRLKRSLFADDEEKEELIGKIEGNVKKLVLTINDIITMNSYNIKKDIPISPLSIKSILDMVHHEIEILSRHRKMFISVEASNNIPEILGNWEALKLMVYNIVLNAVRFTNDFGTIKIGARLSEFQEEKIENKESLVIYVQDNGIGIPVHQIKNIFRKFFEINEIYAHKSGTVEYRSSGLGLGLSVSKRIVELHNGNIWINSKENEGTTVFVSLPIKTITPNKM